MSAILADSEIETVATRAARLLVGRGVEQSPEEGMALLLPAVERGDADAMCLLAALKGAGAWTQQSWPDALDLLQASAERGWRDARLQLALLASDAALAAKIHGNADEPDLWRRAKESIDLQSWVVPPEPRQVHESPRIWTVENFASPALCDWMVSRARGKLKPAMLFDGKEAKLNANRTNSDFVFDIVESGVVMLLVRFRVSAVTQLPIPNMEPPQIFHYALGQEIGAHYDFLFDGTHGYGRTGSYQGDRLATFLLYLNDDYEGGELEFPKVKFRYRGRKGDGIFFASQVSGKPDKMSLHAALPVTGGEKWILSQWIHNQTFAP
jgi:predicted 2-oxoglutarate/Fe(II)-dependent dioxygenase YbiX